MSCSVVADTSPYCKILFLKVTESITNVDTVPVTEEVTVSEPSSVTITAPVLKAEVAEPSNPPIPLRPVMPPETAAFPKLQKVMVTLD